MVNFDFTACFLITSRVFLGQSHWQELFTSWQCFLFLRLTRSTSVAGSLVHLHPTLGCWIPFKFFDAPFVKNFNQSQIHLLFCMGNNRAQETHIHHLTQENYGVQAGLNTITSCLLLQDTLWLFSPLFLFSCLDLFSLFLASNLQGMHSKSLSSSLKVRH